MLIYFIIMHENTTRTGENAAHVLLELYGFSCRKLLLCSENYCTLSNFLCVFFIFFTVADLNKNIAEQAADTV